MCIFNKMKDNPNSLTDREIKTKAYDLFNVMLAEPGERTQKNSSRFYDALRKQGINAVVDVNDSKINNYHAKMPLILFDGEFDNVKKRIMDNKEIQQNMNKHINIRESLYSTIQSIISLFCLGFRHSNPTVAL